MSALPAGLLSQTCCFRTGAQFEMSYKRWFLQVLADVAQHNMGLLLWLKCFLQCMQSKVLRAISLPRLLASVPELRLWWMIHSRHTSMSARICTWWSYIMNIDVYVNQPPDESAWLFLAFVPGTPSSAAKLISCSTNCEESRYDFDFWRQRRY